MKIWLVRTRTTAVWAELEKALPAHLENEQALAANGDLVLAGPLPTPDGSLDGDALSLYHASSGDEARVLAETDPFLQQGLRAITAIELWDVRCTGWRVDDLAAGRRGPT